MAKIRAISSRYTDGKFKSYELDICYPVAWGKAGDRSAASPRCAPKPKTRCAVRPLHPDHFRPQGRPRARRYPGACLRLSAIHQHLVAKGLRTSTGLVVETGSAREVHHFALLGGYGAEAVHPYLALESLLDLAKQGLLGSAIDGKKASTISSRRPARACESDVQDGHLDLHVVYRRADFRGGRPVAPLIDKYFTGTTSNVEGIGVFEVAEEAMHIHAAAFSNDPVLAQALDAGGEYAFRVRGEDHMWTPDAIAKLQHSTRNNSAATYQGIRAYHQRPIRAAHDVPRAVRIPVRRMHADAARQKSSRRPKSSSAFRPARCRSARFRPKRIPMLAIAMNRIGGKSNTGEGGEDRNRYATAKAGETLASRLGKGTIESDIPLKEGDLLKSKIKQVASGRFGVTAEYLASAEQIQIKMAQGAKPGEGGQLPGRKVSEYIALLRYSTPGVELISPPPHHDIYSIEDLAQLIHDLKNANSRASISVKLVSEIGVGTVAAGVAKAKADHVTISGHDGGHGRFAMVVDQARGHAVGAGTRRNPANAGAQPLARPYRGAGRRPDENRPGRRDRRAARRRRVRLRHRAAGRIGLHHDAQVPSQYLSGRRRDAGPGAAQEIPGQARACDQLFLLRRRRGARS